MSLSTSANNNNASVKQFKPFEYTIKCIKQYDDTLERLCHGALKYDISTLFTTFFV